jgi:hypothetical protein
MQSDGSGENTVFIAITNMKEQWNNSQDSISSSRLLFD